MDWGHANGQVQCQHNRKQAVQAAKTVGPVWEIKTFPVHWIRCAFSDDARMLACIVKSRKVLKLGRIITNKTARSRGIG
jgi:hypothetical protein